MTNWGDLSAYRRKVYSQTGEEGILEAIFAAVGTTNRFLVDIGAGDGTTLSNTRLLLESGWHGARFDANYGDGVLQERITAENICDVLAKYGVPNEPDLLSLDIDGIDWYVLRSLLGVYSPRVFVCEINGQLPEEPAVTIVYNPVHAFDETRYYGASLGAFRRLASRHGYACVCVHGALNAFFVLRKLLPPGVSPAVGVEPINGWPVDPQNRPWYQITAEDICC